MELWYTDRRVNEAVTALCAKKKAVPSKMRRMAGESLRSQPLSAAEQKAFSEEFSIYRQFRNGTGNGSNWVSPVDARLHQSAAMAVAAFLCERYAEQYGREAVAKVVSVLVAVPAPLSARMARRTDFLLGAALWLLDYWELHCGSEEEYLSLLPQEPDGLLEYDIPFSEDLDHSRDELLRTLTLLRDRDGIYRKEFRALLSPVDDDAVVGLRSGSRPLFWIIWIGSWMLTPGFSWLRRSCRPLGVQACPARISVCRMTFLPLSARIL